MKRCASVWIGFVLICVLADVSLPARNASADEPAKPQNYAEIKALFEGYALGIDLDDSQYAPRKKLRAKGDDATAALIALFRAAPDLRYRTNIVFALQYSEAKNKKASADLLAQQLPDKAEDWNDLWIVEIIRFLTVADPAEARNVARKGSASKRPEIQLAAIDSLAAAGISDDTVCLEPFVVQLQSENGKRGETVENVLGNAAVSAKERIHTRTSPEKKHSSLTTKLELQNEG